MLKSLHLPYTPNSCDLFRAFSGEAHAILLDSGKPQQLQGRYDIFSAWPEQQLAIYSERITHIDSDKNTHRLDNLEQLKQILLRHQSTDQNDLPFTSGWLGFANYELGGFIEPKSQTLAEQQLLFWAGYYTWAIIQDHQQQSCQLIWLADKTPAQLLQRIQQILQSHINQFPFQLQQSFQTTISQAQYQQSFAKIQHLIQAGDCYQVNYAQQFSAPYQGSEFSAYEKLRNTVPSPYMAFINHPDRTLLSISPERFIAAQQQDVTSKPIKGTAPRSQHIETDQQLAQALIHSAKNCAENIMIVDLMRNDFNRFCRPNSVNVNPLCALESFANVHHLVSTIHGKLRNEHSIWDLFFASFPGGSITGAPKVRACQIIQALESSERGIYCGSIFLASDNGYFDSNIAIRTLTCQNQQITTWAGGGITIDSNADDEYQECFNKINALLNCLQNN